MSISDIFNEISKLKKEIELLKNKENVKCIHSIENHIECNICAHNMDLKSNCLKCDYINSEKIKEKENEFYFEDLLVPTEAFDFMIAVKYLKEGKKIRRKYWQDTNWWQLRDGYIFKRFDEDLICFQYCDDKINHDFKFTMQDLCANDWEIVE